MTLYRRLRREVSDAPRRRGKRRREWAGLKEGIEIRPAGVGGAPVSCRSSEPPHASIPRRRVSRLFPLGALDASRTGWVLLSVGFVYFWYLSWKKRAAVSRSVCSPRAVMLNLEARLPLHLRARPGPGGWGQVSGCLQDPTLPQCPSLPPTAQISHTRASHTRTCIFQVSAGKRRPWCLESGLYTRVYVYNCLSYCMRRLSPLFSVQFYERKHTHRFV